MAIQQIEYDDKVAINIDSAVPDINKCNASDLNEIKEVVNGNSYETPKVSSQVDTDYKVNILSSINLCNGINQGYWLSNNASQCGKSTSDSGLIINVDGGDYTISTTTTQARYRVACIDEIPSGTITAYNGLQRDNTDDEITIDTTNHKYLVVNATDLTKIMVQKGDIVSPYEPFIPNTINVNNEKYTDTINVGTSINDKNRVNVLYSKNLLPYPYVDTTKTTNGITFTDNGDGTITISGTASANASFKLLGDNANQVEIVANYVSGGISANRRVQVVHYNPGYTVIGNSTGTPKEINKSTYTTGYVEIVIASGEAITTPITIKPMLTIKSDDVFEKYVGSPSINVDGEEIYRQDEGRNYIKYSGGTLICWGTNSIESGTWGSWGDIAGKNFDVNIAYPFSFISNPTVQITTISGAWSYEYTTTTSQLSKISFARPNNYATTINYSWIAIGKWK